MLGCSGVELQLGSARNLVSCLQGDAAEWAEQYRVIEIRRSILSTHGAHHEVEHTVIRYPEEALWNL